MDPEYGTLPARGSSPLASDRTTNHIDRRGRIVNPIAWNDISDCISAGSITEISVDYDLSCVRLGVIYGRHEGGRVLEVAIQVDCRNCGYIDVRRVYHYDAGGAPAILEAYLRTDSPLIAALHKHKLDGIAGCLFLEVDPRAPIHHLEIVGEVSINVLCENVVITSTL